MFESWTDDEFNIWLAGFFDGEGCIQVPNVGVDISLSNTVREVVVGIRDKVGVGTIQIVTFDQINWNTKYSWRVRNYPHAKTVLDRIRPYLVIKAAIADEALDKISKKLAVKRERYERYLRIVELIEAGRSQGSIAKEYGITRSMVWWIYNHRPNDETVPHRQVDYRWGQISHQTHIKEPVVVKTKAVKLIT